MCSVAIGGANEAGLAAPETPPVGVSLSSDVELLGVGRKPYRARVRWVDPNATYLSDPLVVTYLLWLV